MDPGSDKQNASYQPHAIGPVLQTMPTTPNAIPSTIVASGNFATGLIASNGWKSISVGVTFSQAGMLTIQRYLDAAGNISVGMPIAATLSANTANWANVNDGVAFAYFQVTVANTSGSTGNLSNFGILLAAA